jgi:RNA polymerase sigma-70 factor (ECF subfamily)
VGSASYFKKLPQHSAFRTQTFPRLLASLRRGDPQAFSAMFESYGDWLRNAIRRVIHPRLRKRYDSVDFLQSTWASIITKCERLPNLADAEQFARYLVQVAYNKVSDANRALNTKKRDSRRECTLLELEDGHTGRDVIGDRRQPRPSEFFHAREQYERVAEFVKQYPERLREIPYRRASGESLKQIAREVGVNERTVRRILKRLYDDIQREP